MSWYKANKYKGMWGLRNGVTVPSNIYEMESPGYIQKNWRGWRRLKIG